MANVGVHIKKRGEPKAELRASFAISVCDKFVFRFPALKNVIDKKLPLRPELPNVTYQAIEAAVQSGAFYARHKTNSKTFSVELTLFEMEGGGENVIPFAVATTVAVYALDGLRTYTESDVSGWEVVRVEAAENGLL